MENRLTHFAIFTDDQSRAKTFYANVFGWGFNTYGLDGFSQINSNPSDSGELIGALQDRKYQLTDEKVIGFECSISVENVDEIASLVLDHGGEVLLPKSNIPGVGWLIKFRDTEGNILCAIEYEEHIKKAMTGDGH